MYSRQRTPTAWLGLAGTRVRDGELGHGPCLPSGRSLLPPGASRSPRRALAELWAAPAASFPRVLPKAAPEELLGPGAAAPGPGGR